ncbi:MAG: hypothetical protein TUN42_08400 [Dehalogenimonas sp.]
MFAKKAAMIASVLLGLLLSFGVFRICYANSAPPPRIVIVVNNAPPNLELSIGQTNASRDDRLTTSYFVIHPYFEKSAEFRLTVTNGADTFELPIEGVQYTFNNVYTLDLSSRQLASGPPASRFIWLPVTILLTLALEGIVFFLFRYRIARSWLIFVVINVLTQLGLYYWLSQNSDFLDNYILLTYVIGEFFVFIIEIVAFVVLLREHGRLRAAAYAFTANLFSLVAGGYLLMVLPASF